MVRNIVVLGGSSHPQLTKVICNHLGVPPANVLLDKFSVGETRVEIKESVRGKDVYIIQSGGGKVNDHLMELLVMISACKTASARQVTAVLPLFPYSKQSDIPYNKTGAPLVRASNCYNKPDFPYTMESVPQTPHPDHTPSAGLFNGIENLTSGLSKIHVYTPTSATNGKEPAHNTPLMNGHNRGSDSADFADSPSPNRQRGASTSSTANTLSHEDTSSLKSASSKSGIFQPQPGYKQWVAQAGTLVADLLTCAGADHVITMDLHDAQYQGFFDIPVDNLYGRPLLKRYIQYQIPDYQQAVIERRPTKIADRQNATMMLVGDVTHRTAILIDDLADTSNTITRAAKLLKKEGATKVFALVTHGILSGEAIDRINVSALDKVVVTNSVPQEEHKRRCPKLEVLEIGQVFAEAIRRVHHGESISVLFQYD